MYDPINSPFGYPDNGPGKKQLILGALIMLAVVIGGVGVFYYQKRGGLNFLSSKKYEFINEPQIDTDGDGLFDHEEKIYNTDVNKVDTDGDGYSDYEEVRKGYNPLGEGKIDQEITTQKIIKPAKEFNDLKDLSKAREYMNISEGFSLVLPPGWIYVREGEYTEFRLGKEIRKANLQVSVVPTSMYSQYFNKDWAENVSLREFDKLLGSMYGASETASEKKKISVDGHSGYRYTYSNNEQHYIVHVKRKTEYSKFNIESDDFVFIKTDYYNKADSNTKTDIEKIIKSIDIFSSSGQAYTEYYSGKAIPTLDFCSKIQGIRQRDDCFYDLAIRFSDKSYCEYVQAEEKSYDCHKIAVDPSIACFDKTNKDSCYFDIAVARLDVELCKKIKKPESNSTCKFNIAFLSGDPNICAGVGGYMRDRCYAEIATKAGKEDYALCAKINSELARINCYNEIIRNTKNPTICADMVDVGDDEIIHCYIAYAIKEKDKAICDHIENSGERENCKTYIDSPSAAREYLDNRIQKVFDKYN